MEQDASANRQRMVCLPSKKWCGFSLLLLLVLSVPAHALASPWLVSSPAAIQASSRHQGFAPAWATGWTLQETAHSPWLSAPSLGPSCSTCRPDRPLPWTRSQRHIRRWHQILGIASTALMLTTSLIGDANVLDTWDHRLPSQGLLTAHHALIVATSVAYLATQIISWMDPLLFRRPSLRRWFRILRWIHTIGFVTMIGLGILNARLTPGATTGKIIASIAHMSVGYISLGALGVGTLLLFF